VKAYWCGGDIFTCAEIVFAETASKARYISWSNQESSEDCELFEIEVQRCPEADKHAEKPGVWQNFTAWQWREVGGSSDTN
jgi:hypothetical protein